MEDYAKKYPEYKVNEDPTNYKQPQTKIHKQFVKDVICPRLRQDYPLMGRYFD